MEQYHNGGGGTLSLSTDGSQSFIRSSKAEPDWPNLWIQIQPEVSVDEEEQGPKSKGTLTFDTNKYKAGIRDDAEFALIDYKFLTHPDDIEAILEGTKQISLTHL